MCVQHILLHHNQCSTVSFFIFICKKYKGFGLYSSRQWWCLAITAVDKSGDNTLLPYCSYLAKLAHISAETVSQGFQEQLQQRGSMVGPAIAASQGERIFKVAALWGKLNYGTCSDTCRMAALSHLSDPPRPLWSMLP